MRIALVVVALVACGKSETKPEAPAATADISKLRVAIDGKPMAIDRAFIKRVSQAVYAVMLGEGKGSCEMLLGGTDAPEGRAIGFTITTRLAATGHENFVITDLWSREFPATVPLPKQIKLTGDAANGTTVAIDLGTIGDTVLSLEGSVIAIGCGEVAPTGLGVPKAKHTSRATIAIAGKKIPVAGVVVSARKGVAATDLPDITISAGPKDCSGVTIPAPVILERKAAKWTLNGTYFEQPIAGEDPSGLAFSANEVGESVDGATITLQLAGKAKFGDYTVELSNTVEAIECVH